jgi:coronin-1B/1C/6
LADEYEADELHYLTEYKSSSPQRGMTFLPRRALNIADHEIARAYKVTNNQIEPISFTVPRKVRRLMSASLLMSTCARTERLVPG